ncbi:hypothetical protein GIS00_06270 [Nakamurella sp. YIM 132087]|uniref:HEAT repeat domain-containing protein n=1 Tax=Nakamurella alba TaxID=2665158 RepID=A0A7K1FJD0_9ACTN|nr:HEAT repeat domain-containing protein [Nakamurella alba]MTD13549.1 hypothetical protein [Nakamurella alba]
MIDEDGLRRAIIRTALDYRDGDHDEDAEWLVPVAAEFIGPGSHEVALDVLRTRADPERVVAAGLFQRWSLQGPSGGWRPGMIDDLARISAGTDQMDVLTALVRALVALGDDRAFPVLASRVSDPDPDIRWVCALELPGAVDWTADPLAGRAELVDLARDPDEHVREWALFAIGSQSPFDGSDIRELLVESTLDPVEAVRHEALRGLARRRDRRATPGITYLLEQNEVSSQTLFAAAMLGDPSLMPLLRTVEEREDSEPTGEIDELRLALLTCDPRRREQLATFGQDLLEELHRLHPGGAWSLHCEKFEGDVVLSGPGSGWTWALDPLRRRAGDNAARAARLAVQDLAQES